MRGRGARGRGQGHKIWMGRRRGKAEVGFKGKRDGLGANAAAPKPLCAASGVVAAPGPFPMLYIALLMQCRSLLLIIYCPLVCMQLTKPATMLNCSVR